MKTVTLIFAFIASLALAACTSAPAPTATPLPTATATPEPAWNYYIDAYKGESGGYDTHIAYTGEIGYWEGDADRTPPSIDIWCTFWRYPEGGVRAEYRVNYTPHPRLDEKYSAPVLPSVTIETGEEAFTFIGDVMSSGQVLVQNGRLSPDPEGATKFINFLLENGEDNLIIDGDIIPFAGFNSAISEVLTCGGEVEWPPTPMAPES